MDFEQHIKYYIEDKLSMVNQSGVVILPILSLEESRICPFFNFYSFKNPRNGKVFTHKSV